MRIKILTHFTPLQELKSEGICPRLCKSVMKREWEWSLEYCSALGAHRHHCRAEPRVLESVSNVQEGCREPSPEAEAQLGLEQD